MYSKQANCNSAVVLLAYNRPKETLQVLRQIQIARPARFLVVADGPKPGCSKDKQLCEEVRELVHREVNWDCKISTHFSPLNQGCGKNVAKGLDWAFRHVDEAIILEDDCLPGPTFFPFCEALLNYYREDTRIAQICGAHGIGNVKMDFPSSYCFSRFGPIWGWATWKRAWDLYDFSLEDWPIRSERHWMKQYPGTLREKIWRKSIYTRVKDGSIDTWDYQWGYAKFKHRVLSVIPSVNLVQNIGFGRQATHTRKPSVQPEPQVMDFPLRHPVSVVPYARFDREFSASYTPSWFRLGWQFARRAIAKGGLR